MTQIMFEQYGGNLLEGRLTCNSCGFQGIVHVSEFFNHVRYGCLRRRK
jgi:hypothetical protein